MTFNEWWAGQNLPEESRVVALAAWYASQLYGEHTRHPTVITAPLGLTAAHGAQLDVLGEHLGVVREHDTHGIETDQSYRARLIQKHRHVGCSHGGGHQWASFEMLGGHSEVRCGKCGERPS